MKVIVRPPGEAFRRALSEHPDKAFIDPESARREHAAFVTALREAGVEVAALPADDELPDACFVSDVLLTLPRAGDAGGRAVLAVAPDRARPVAGPRWRPCSTWLAASSSRPAGWSSSVLRLRSMPAM